jgi:hypothetical protein
VSDRPKLLDLCCGAGGSAEGYARAGFALTGRHCDHGWQTPRFPQATNRVNLRSTVEVGVRRIPLDVQKRAMGVDWTVTREELSQAVPPAFTRFIGEQLMGYISAEATA